MSFKNSNQFTMSQIFNKKYVFNILLLFSIVDLSYGQAINDNSPYALYPSRHFRPQDDKQTTGYLSRHRQNSHRRRNRQKKTQLSVGMKTSQSSRIAFNSDYNLQRDYIATTVGREIRLDCKIRDLVNDDGKIVWLKMPKGEILTLNENRVTADQRISSECNQNQMPCWSLIIKEVRESDTGFYVCQTNSMQTKYIYLDIMVPPKLLTNYPVDRIDVNQSMNAIIECEFYGKPEPLIKWYKYKDGNQKEIEKYRGHKTINLFIQKDTPSELECVADNSIPPTVSKKIYLNIQYEPIVNFLNRQVYQRKGEDVIFDCDVQSNPLSRIYWFKNHSRITESNKYRFEILENNFYRLFIKNITAEDYGIYHLRAINKVGKSGAKIELIQLPDETTTTTTTINYHNRIEFMTDQTRKNKTQIILSKIFNQNKNKNMKNSLHIEDEDSEETWQARSGTEQNTYRAPIRPEKAFYKSNNQSHNWYKANAVENAYNLNEKKLSSTLTYHILQIENKSIRVKPELFVTFISLFSLSKLTYYFS